MELLAEIREHDGFFFDALVEFRSFVGPVGFRNGRRPANLAAIYMTVEAAHDRAIENDVDVAAGLHSCRPDLKPLAVGPADPLSSVSDMRRRFGVGHVSALRVRGR